MKNKLSKSKILVMQSGASLVAVFAMLVISVAAVISLSFGWFAKNNQVTANGMHMQAYTAKFDIAFKETGGTETDLNKIMAELKVPGQSVQFDIVITSTGLYEVDLMSVGLEAPSSADETPLVQNGKYYYLSTELSTRLTAAKITKAGESESEDLSITNTDLTKRLRDQKTLVADRVNYFDWLGAQPITLNKGDCVTLTVEIEFVDSGAPQNEYKYFASKGSCKRSIFISYNE